MNQLEFSAALSGLINSGLLQGLAKGSMDVAQMIGELECAKLDLVRYLQDQIAKPTATPVILPAPGIPPKALTKER